MTNSTIRPSCKCMPFIHGILICEESLFQAFERIPLCTYVLLRGDRIGTLDVEQQASSGPPSPKWIPELGICGHCQLENQDNCSIVPQLVCNKTFAVDQPTCSPQAWFSFPLLHCMKSKENKSGIMQEGFFWYNDNIKQSDV